LIMVSCALAHDRPVIGILTTPASDISVIHSSANYSFIPYSYVQSVEAAGARVVPIPYDAPAENITYLLKQLNGVLFTGGGADLNKTDQETGKLGPTNITAAGEFIIRKIIEANDNGEYFPLLTTCQGWEILVFAIGKDYDILQTGYNDFKVSSSVLLTPPAFNSGPWATMQPHLQKTSQTEPFFLYNHFFALTPEDFYENKLLDDFFDITGISHPVLTDGPPFVASAQAKNYPIWGQQFHPEKNAFFWKKAANASHTPDSILATQHLTNFFVNEARKNHNVFQSSEILSHSMIDSWRLTNVSPIAKGYDFVYLFPKVETFPEAYPNLSATNLIRNGCVGLNCVSS